MSVCIAFFLPFDCAAQGRSQKDGLPRIGTIKDYEATGLTVGCGNYYFHRPQEAKSPGARYIFIARSDGSNAWMNLGGRDTRLQQIKSTARDGRKTRPLNYRLGRLRVSVLIEELKPEDSPAGEDFFLKMGITLRKGRAVRTARAIGYADC
ncbi:MAG TPA: hypothetical protein VJ842_13130 [Pyrinomonadaceae bacterium]|nr:hypothetical protein [Pyrinomonadaceae bacterium]